jgi:hypothetical protein
MSPGYDFTTHLIPAIVAQFTTQKTAITAAINVGVAADLAIVEPAQVLDFAPTPATLEGDLPLIGIADFPTRFEDDLVHSLTGIHQLAILAAIANPDERALAWQLRRYRSLIARMIQVDRTFGGLCRPAMFDQIAPGPMMGNTNPEREHSYLSWFYYVITCKVDEF